METPEQCVKSVQSSQKRHYNDIKKHPSGVFIVNFDIDNRFHTMFSCFHCYLLIVVGRRRKKVAQVYQQ